MKEVVDLGLPSKTLWCKYNLGATCEPNNNKSWYGNYYAWGELEPNKSDSYNWDSYKFSETIRKTTFADIEKRHITKYSEEDNLTRLEPDDDIAYQNMHIGQLKFHIPTKEQFEELKKYTTYKFYYDNYIINGKKISGLAGCEFTSTINENKIFFPASGKYMKIVGKNSN